MQYVVTSGYPCGIYNIHLADSTKRKIMNSTPTFRSLQSCSPSTVLQFNLIRVEIRELRPKVVAENDGWCIGSLPK